MRFVLVRLEKTGTHNEFVVHDRKFYDGVLNEEVFLPYHLLFEGDKINSNIPKNHVLYAFAQALMSDNQSKTE